MKKILLFIVMLLMPITVWAVKPDPSIDPIDGGDTAGSCGGKNCYSTGYSGVRISIVDMNGNMIKDSKTYDYWFSSANAEARYRNNASYCFNKKNNLFVFKYLLLYILDQT